MRMRGRWGYMRQTDGDSGVADRRRGKSGCHHHPLFSATAMEEMGCGQASRVVGRKAAQVETLYFARTWYEHDCVWEFIPVFSQQYRGTLCMIPAPKGPRSPMPKMVDNSRLLDRFRRYTDTVNDRHQHSLLMCLHFKITMNWSLIQHYSDHKAFNCAPRMEGGESNDNDNYIKTLYSRPLQTSGFVWLKIKCLLIPT